MTSEADAFDAMTDEDYEAIGRILEDREDRLHGQQILDAVASQGSGEERFLEVLRRAHQAKAEADKE